MSDHPLGPLGASTRSGSSTGSATMARPCAVALACLGLAGAAAVHAAPTEIDRDAYWIESAVCTVSIRSAPVAGAAEPGLALGALTSAPATCVGNLMSQAVPGGVHSLLQRGFRIKSATHHVALLPPRTDGEPPMLVTALFVLERPAVKPPPVFR